ncbi:MAG: hypothetical protein R2873_22720 [Caldilineaceae bacterium]
MRALSERFDGWNPPSFRLSAAQIESIIAEIPAQTIEDLHFAQAQIRRFAEVQPRSRTWKWRRCPA